MCACISLSIQYEIIDKFLGRKSMIKRAGEWVSQPASQPASEQTNERINEWMIEQARKRAGARIYTNTDTRAVQDKRIQPHSMSLKTRVGND